MQPFKLAGGSDKRLSLLCSSTSAAFSHVTLALNENVLWKRVSLFVHIKALRLGPYISMDSAQ